MVQLLRGETINFDKIYSDNLNIDNSTCKLEVITKNVKNNNNIIKTIEAIKDNEYFKALVNTDDIPTKEFNIIITIQEFDIIAKEKIEFRFE